MFSNHTLFGISQNTIHLLRQLLIFCVFLLMFVNIFVAFGITHFLLLVWWWLLIKRICLEGRHSNTGSYFQSVPYPKISEKSCFAFLHTLHLNKVMAFWKQKIKNSFSLIVFLIFKSIFIIFLELSYEYNSTCKYDINFSIPFFRVITF